MGYLNFAGTLFGNFRNDKREKDEAPAVLPAFMTLRAPRHRHHRHSL